jgi:AcrR family transcriptional regulator
VGPDEVTRAVLDAAADLFAREGVSEVSLRQIADAADVHIALIRRYVGTRDELVHAVLDDLSGQVAAQVTEMPLGQISFERDSAMGRWTRVLAHFTLTGQDPIPSDQLNPMLALARVTMDEYGMDEAAARLRGAQIVASALGWRLFEDYLVDAAGLDAIPRPVLRDELTALHRRIGATPWPSPPDPPRRTRPTI